MVPGTGVTSSNIAIPGRPPWLIPRPRLVERLRKGTNSTLTVVTGPPGAGKTMAVLSWALAGQTPGPIAWISLRGEDDQAELFWPLVVTALRRAGVDVYWSGSDNALTELALDLTARERPVVVVLDDLRTSQGSAVSRDLSWLLAGARPWLRLVVTARRDPALPLHRYSLAGELATIRLGDIAFSAQEAGQLLTQHQVRLAPASLRALLRRTEGWAAGLRLAAISMEGHPDPDAFVARFAGDDKSVVSYLIEEVLDAQPPAQRRLMLVSSVPDRVDAELAAELAGADLGAAFAQVVRENAFVVQLEHGWYRLHPMFAEALRLVLRHEAPGELAALDLRAAAWFARKGAFHDAVHHAARAGDWAYASRLVVQQFAVGRLLGLRPDHELTETMRRMPAWAKREAREPEQEIAVAAVARGQAEEEECARALAAAAALIEAAPDPPSLPVRLALGMIRLMDRRPHGPDRPAAVAEVEELIRQAPPGSLDDHPEVHALALTSRGRLRLESGLLEEAADAFGAALALASQIGGDYLSRCCLGHLALVDCLRGRLSRAAELTARAERLPEVCSAPARRRVAAAHLASAWVALQHLDQHRLRHELSKAGTALDEAPDAVLAALHTLVTAEGSLAEDRPGHAVDTVRAVVRPPDWLRHRLALAEAEALGQLGEIAEARDAATRAGPQEHARREVTLARLAVRADEPEVAGQALRDLLADPGGVPADVRLDAWLLTALLSYRRGDPARGRRALHRALHLGDREHLALPFARSKAWLRPLLRRHPDLAGPYTRFLERFGLHSRADPGAESSVVYGRLSARELDVLRCLSKVMTTEEIAAQMYVSVNTVKTHLRSIYRKLGVTRRGEAVRRANDCPSSDQGSSPGGSRRISTSSRPSAWTRSSSA